ncbi:hypothetical protein JCM18899A_01530 [Nocardioides sp. AN3]
MTESASVKDRAQDRQVMDQAKDTAAESASRVKDEGQSAAEHVRSDAQG